MMRRRVAAGADVANHRPLCLVLLLRDHQNLNATDLDQYFAMDGADLDQHFVQNKGFDRLNIYNKQARLLCSTGDGMVQ